MNEPLDSATAYTQARVVNDTQAGINTYEQVVAAFIAGWNACVAANTAPRPY